MAKNIFQQLNIDRSKILDLITEYCENNFKEFNVKGLHSVGKLESPQECIINLPGKEIKIHFYFNSDGTTTISPRVGKEVELSVKVATFILEKLEFKPGATSSSYSVKLTQEQFDFVIQYFSEIEGCKKVNETRSDNGHYSLFQFKSHIGDQVTFKYFDNGTLLVQGKPYYLYVETTYLLAGYFPFDEMLKKQTEMYHVPLSVEEVHDEIRELFPNAYSIFEKYDGRLKSVFAGSLALRKIDIELPDYSSFVHPALKTLEGYIIILLQGKNIDYNRKNGFDMFYKNDFNDKHLLNADTRTTIACDAYCGCLEDAYNYFSKYRHTYFHVGEVIADTPLIETKAKADVIINGVIAVIEKTYVTAFQ